MSAQTHSLFSNHINTFPSQLYHRPIELNAYLIHNQLNEQQVKALTSNQIWKPIFEKYFQVKNMDIELRTSMCSFIRDYIYKCSQCEYGSYYAAFFAVYADYMHLLSKEGTPRTLESLRYFFSKALFDDEDTFAEALRMVCTRDFILSKHSYNIFSDECHVYYSIPKHRPLDIIRCINSYKSQMLETSTRGRRLLVLQRYIEYLESDKVWQPIFIDYFSIKAPQSTLTTKKSAIMRAAQNILTSHVKSQTYLTNFFANYNKLLQFISQKGGQKLEFLTQTCFSRALQRDREMMLKFTQEARNPLFYYTLFNNRMRITDILASDSPIEKQTENQLA